MSGIPSPIVQLVVDGAERNHTRPHAVPCQICWGRTGQQTWADDGICDDCTEAAGPLPWIPSSPVQRQGRIDNGQA